MESSHIVFFDDAEAIINITFPDFRRDGWTVNRTVNREEDGDPYDFDGDDGEQETGGKLP